MAELNCICNHHFIISPDFALLFSVLLSFGFPYVTFILHVEDLCYSSAVCYCSEHEGCIIFCFTV